MTLRLGTRASKLAVWQTEFVADRLRALRPGVDCQVVHISTHGDEDQNRPLPEIGGKGLFTERIEEALREKRIDAAVHSLKDLPIDDSPGLTIAAVLGREEARDVVVSRDRVGLSGLPAGAVVGTSSTRREAQLRALRPDLTIKPIRGNVETRINKVDRGEYDATVIAGAGVIRLGLADKVSEWIDVDTCLPAPGQGALAVQCRAGDQSILELLGLIDDKVLHRAATAEREFLGGLGGGCAAPVAAYATVRNDARGTIVLQGRVISLDGLQVIEVKGEGDDPGALARRLADEAMSAGATRILAEAHAPSPNGHPLKDKRVLVTRPREQASELVSLLCAHGAIPLLLPLIRVEPAGETSRIEAALEGLSTYDWVIFTSSNGVEHFFSHLGKRPFSQKTAAVGPATSQALFARGITPGFVPSEHTGSALARGLHEREAGTLEGKRFLMPCAAQHNEEAARVLRAAGATVDELPVYRTVSEEPTLADLEAIDGDIDAVLFLSSSAVRSFQALTATTPSLAAALSRAVVACIGPSTAETARDAGMRVDLVSSEHTSKALVLALEERFR